MKDTNRKISPISLDPVEWNRSIVRAIEVVGFFVTVSQKKRDRVKGIMESIVG